MNMMIISIIIIIIIIIITIFVMIRGLQGSWNATASPWSAPA